MMLVTISGLDNNVRIGLVNSRVLNDSLMRLWLELLPRHHLVVRVTLLTTWHPTHSILRELLTRWHSSRLPWLWLDIVIC
jgi:hypothetical protein